MPGSEFRTTGERRREGLALAGAHLGDRAGVQHHAADDLDVEMAHAHLALAGLADDREGLGKEVVELRAVARLLAERVHPLAQLVVGLELELGLEVVDASDALFELPELLGFAHTEGAVEDRHSAEGTNATAGGRRVGG